MSIEQALAFHTEAFRAVALWSGLSLLFVLALSMRISAG